MTKSTINDDIAALGWKACRTQVFAFAEHTMQNTDPKNNDFEHGRYYEAKSIAKAFGSFGPAECDELAKALAPPREGSKDPEFKTGNELLDELLAQTWAWAKSGLNSAVRATWWREALQDYSLDVDPWIMSNEEIRAIFIHNGFTVKPGETDLKPYVYKAAEALLSEQYRGKALTRPDPGCVHIVRPDGSVRHNVGSDNLSDEDRRDMAKDYDMQQEANRVR